MIEINSIYLRKIEKDFRRHVRSAIDKSSAVQVHNASKMFPSIHAEVGNRAK